MLSALNDHVVTLDNGIVSMALNITTASVLTYRFHGVNLLETSPTAYDVYEKNAGHMGGYFSSNAVASGVGGTGYWNPVNCSYSVVTQTAEMVEVKLSTASPQFFDHEFHFVLRRGDHVSINCTDLFLQSLCKRLRATAASARVLDAD
jgi:hypothetical protein